MPTDPVRGSGRDEGLASERTQLAWERSSPAVVVAVGVLARRVGALPGVEGVVAPVVVAIGALTGLAGVRSSRRLELSMEPHGMTGRHAFGLMTGGTLVLACGVLLFGVLVTGCAARRW